MTSCQNPTFPAPRATSAVERLTYPTAVLSSPLALTTADKMVLTALVGYVNDRTLQCYPRVATLAKNASIGKRGVYAALKRLQAASLIRRQRRRDERGLFRNFYRITGLGAAKTPPPGAATAIVNGADSRPAPVMPSRGKRKGRATSQAVEARREVPTSDGKATAKGEHTAKTEGRTGQASGHDTPEWRPPGETDPGDRPEPVAGHKKNTDRRHNTDGRKERRWCHGRATEGRDRGLGATILPAVDDAVLIMARGWQRLCSEPWTLANACLRVEKAVGRVGPTRARQALIDRRLYLPEAWAGDEARRKAAHIPEDMAFATKPVIARAMLADALDRGVPYAWVLADAAYGGDYQTRRMLEERRQSYVLAIRSNHTLRMLADQGLPQTDPKEMAEGLSDDAWPAHPAGEGATGLRLYDWAAIRLPHVVDEGYVRYGLIRGSRSDPRAFSYYLVFAPAGTTLMELAGAAGLRWTIEECFQRAKDDLGLDIAKPAHGRAGTVI